MSDTDGATGVDPDQSPSGSDSGPAQARPSAPRVPARPPLAPMAHVTSGALFSLIPKFDGRGLTWTDWKGRVEGAVRMSHLTPALQAELVIHSLEGSARRVVTLTPPSERDTLEKVLGLLEAIYGRPLTAVQLRARFFTRVQGEGEDLVEFASALRENLRDWVALDPGLVARLGDQDLLIRDQFVGGLFHRLLQDKLRDMVRADNQLPFAKVFAAALERERELTPSSTGVVETVTTPECPAIAPVMEALQGLAQGLQRVQQEVTQMRAQAPTDAGALRPRPPPRPGPERRVNPPRCWRCHERGHVARECPVPFEGERPLNYRSPQ